MHALIFPSSCILQTVGKSVWKWHPAQAKYLEPWELEMPVRHLICFLPPSPLPLPPRSDLKTALVERSDFSSGTSSRSTKLIHGGVRYLQKAVMKLDYEQVKVLGFLLRSRERLGWAIAMRRQSRTLTFWKECERKRKKLASLEESYMFKIFFFFFKSI